MANSEKTPVLDKADPSAGKEELAKEVSFEESAAELESGDLFADDDADNGEAFIDEPLDAIDDMIFEEDPPPEAVEPVEAVEVEAEVEPAGLEATAAKTASSNAVDPDVSAATGRIAPVERPLSDEAVADDPAEAPTQAHLQIPEEFIAMDPEQAQAISRRLGAVPGEPSNTASIVEETPECRLDFDEGPQTKLVESPSVEATAPVTRKSSRVGLVVIVGLGLAGAAVLVYILAIRGSVDPVSIPSARPSTAVTAPIESRPASDAVQGESVRKLPGDRPEPASGPIVFGRKNAPSPEGVDPSAQDRPPPVAP